MWGQLVGDLSSRCECGLCGWIAIDGKCLTLLSRWSRQRKSYWSHSSDAVYGSSQGIEATVAWGE